MFWSLNIVILTDAYTVYLWNKTNPRRCVDQITTHANKLSHKIILDPVIIGIVSNLSPGSIGKSHTLVWLFYLQFRLITPHVRASTLYGPTIIWWDNVSFFGWLRASFGLDRNFSGHFLYFRLLVTLIQKYAHPFHVNIIPSLVGIIHSHFILHMDHS